jgi:hypothetical protein
MLRDDIKGYPTVIPFEFKTVLNSTAEEEEDFAILVRHGGDTILDHKMGIFDSTPSKEIDMSAHINREFDKDSSKLIDFVMANPQDAPKTVELKAVLRSFVLLFVILFCNFTIACYVFPGSFQPFSSGGQYHTSSQIRSLFSEPTEYSESGGVVWGDFEIPQPKTMVTVTPGLPKIVRQEESRTFWGGGLVEDL